MREEDILDYLKNEPQFFERHASALADIRLRSPYGNRTVSLQERQAEMLREKIKILELRTMEMIRHGNENTLTLEKLQRWTLGMLSARDAQSLADSIVAGLEQQFFVPQVALRLWDVPEQLELSHYQTPVSEDSRELAHSLTQCFCGADASYEPAQWLAQPELASSMALLPLRHEGQTQAFGLLVLASPDPERFAAHMGTEFLERIAAVASAALSRFM